MHETDTEAGAEGLQNQRGFESAAAELVRAGAVGAGPLGVPRGVHAASRALPGVAGLRHYPRDPDPEIRKKEATGDKVFHISCLFSKESGLWVWGLFHSAQDWMSGTVLEFARPGEGLDGVAADCGTASLPRRHIVSVRERTQEEL